MLTFDTNAMLNARTFIRCIRKLIAANHLQIKDPQGLLHDLKFCSIPPTLHADLPALGPALPRA